METFSTLKISKLLSLHIYWNMLKDLGTYFNLLHKTAFCFTYIPFTGQEQAESWVPDVSGVFWGFPGWSWVPGSSCWFIHAAIHSPSADWCGSWRWCHKCCKEVCFWPEVNGSKWKFGAYTFHWWVVILNPILQERTERFVNPEQQIHKSEKSLM